MSSQARRKRGLDISKLSRATDYEDEYDESSEFEDDEEEEDEAEDEVRVDMTGSYHPHRLSEKNGNYIFSEDEGESAEGDETETSMEPPPVPNKRNGQATPKRKGESANGSSSTSPRPSNIKSQVYDSIAQNGAPGKLNVAGDVKSIQARRSIVSSERVQMISLSASQLEELKQKLDMVDRLTRECRAILQSAIETPVRGSSAMSPPSPPPINGTITELSARKHESGDASSVSSSSSSSSFAVSQIKSSELATKTTAKGHRDASPKLKRGRKRASVYRGLSKHPHLPGHWRVHVTIDGQRVVVGTFHDEVTGAEYYDQVTRRTFGTEGCAGKLNFPGDAERIDAMDFEPLKVVIKRGRPRKSNVDE